MNRLSVRGSKPGTKKYFASIHELVKSGHLKPPMNHIEHQDIPDAIDTLLEGCVIGRLITMYDEDANRN